MTRITRITIYERIRGIREIRGYESREAAPAGGSQLWAAGRIGSWELGVNWELWRCGVAELTRLGTITQAWSSDAPHRGAAAALRDTSPRQSRPCNPSRRR